MNVTIPMKDHKIIVEKARRDAYHEGYKQGRFDEFIESQYGIEDHDIIPVIRCRDCKHWLPHTQFGYDADYEEYHNYCKRHLPDDDFYAFIKEADDFCSWAERKEE